MKVLHISPSFFPATAYGGPVESLRLLTKGLSANGCSVEVVTTDANGAERLNLRKLRREDNSGVEVQYCKRWWGASLAPALPFAVVRRLDWADVLHLTAVYSFATLPTLALARVFRKPIVWSPRGALLAHANGNGRVLAKRIWLEIAKRLAPSWTYIHATSPEEATAAERLLGLQAALVPNPVDDDASRICAPVARDRTEILFVGRIDPIKGLENLIDACASRRSYAAPWRLTIAGGGSAGYVASLRERVDSAGVGEHVRFVGKVDSVMRDELLAGSSFLVLPSYSENFGMVVVEALAAGVPVIASQGTPWRELETHGCGLWVSNEPDALANAIDRMEAEVTPEWAARGREWVLAEFSLSGVARKMTDVYRHAMAAGEANG